MTTPRRPGRPASFDRADVLERSVAILWRHGAAGATTRALERALAISQSSLYNTFGSKADFVDLVVEHYSAALEADVVAKLDTADRPGLLAFVDAVADWVGDDDHRGCLLLNVATEDPTQGFRLARYRERLRQAVGPAVASFTADPVLTDERTELVVASVIGLGLSARTGADRGELDALRRAITNQISAW